MFTTINKLRTIVTGGAVGAAFASSGVASAASVVHRPGTGTPVVVSQPTTVAMYINPNNVGSAGIAGYDDAHCQSLVNSHNAHESGAVKAAAGGDALLAKGYAELAGDLQTELESNSSSLTDRGVAADARARGCAIRRSVKPR
jgi:hypothetical protein